VPETDTTRGTSGGRPTPTERGLIGDDQSRVQAPNAEPRKVTVIISNRETGSAVVRSYPDNDGKTYVVPLYDASIKGISVRGESITKHYHVVRFGVQYDKEGGKSPGVVGLKNEQTHVLKWIKPPHLESAWQVTGEWLIHEGADNPSRDAWGALGCVEVTGHGQWNDFNNVIKLLSGKKHLDEVSKAGALTATFEPVAERPPLREKP